MRSSCWKFALKKVEETQVAPPCSLFYLEYIQYSNAVFVLLIFNTVDVHSGLCQISVMELFFVKIVSDFWKLIIFAKVFIIDIWQGPKSVSEYVSEKYVTVVLLFLSLPANAFQKDVFQ